MHLRHGRGVEARAVGVLVAGVRAAAVTRVPHDQAAQVAVEDRRAGAGHGHARLAGRVALPGGSPERVRGGDHGHRGEEVAADHPRVEAGQHRHPADRPARGCRAASDGQPVTRGRRGRCRQGSDEPEHRDEVATKDEQPVAELDDPVDPISAVARTSPRCTGARWGSRAPTR